MEPLELVNAGLDEPVGEFLIFTHSVRSRLAVVTLFASYFIVFGLFTNFLSLKIQEMENTPDLFVAAQNGIARWAAYGALSVGWLFAIAVLIYLAYATFDFWGLQVWVSRRQLVVKNTILGDVYKRVTGVGSLDLESVTTISGGRYTTTVTTETERVFFSPVDRLDLLVATVIEYSPRAKLEI